MMRAENIEGALEVKLREDEIDAALREHLFRPMTRWAMILKMIGRGGDGANDAA